VTQSQKTKELIYSNIISFLQLNPSLEDKQMDSIIDSVDTGIGLFTQDEMDLITQIGIQGIESNTLKPVHLLLNPED
jgi:hypothetical protein